jgi:hypothetical protein
MRVENRANLSVERLAAIEHEHRDHHGLIDVIEWGRKHPPGSVTTRIIEEVVAQDEFTHDAIVPWRDVVLVYGVT